MKLRAQARGISDYEISSPLARGAKSRTEDHQSPTGNPVVLWCVDNNMVTPANNTHIIDAQGKVLGRLASEVAVILSGKHTADFSRARLAGDFVEVRNVAQIRLSGSKETRKRYVSHSGYPGGRKVVRYRELVAKNPTRAFQHAVAGMLPKNRLRARMLKRLRIIA